MTQTVVGNPDSSSLAPGIPAAGSNGIADGDEDLDNDGTSSGQEWLQGTNPLVAQNNNTDSDGDGMPDWFEILLGGSASPWEDSDVDGVPNSVEFDIGSNPALADYGAGFPPPPLADAEFVSLQYSVPYNNAQGPNGNPYFPTAALSAGALGVTATMTIEPSNFGGPGVANVKLDIMPNQKLYNNVWPFTDDGTPSQGEVQKPDPLDGDDYRMLISLATDFADELWGEIEAPVLQVLRQRTLEHVSAVSIMKINYYCREIQWMEYDRLAFGDQPGILMRMQRRVSQIHTEVTKLTAIHMEYVDRYPNLNYVSKVLKAVSWANFAFSLQDSLQSLKARILEYVYDVNNQINLAGADLLSLEIQSFLDSIPGMPAGLISTTIPIFSPCPLELYEGGGAQLGDCPFEF